MELTIYTREYNTLDTIQNFMDFYYSNNSVNIPRKHNQKIFLSHILSQKSEKLFFKFSVYMSLSFYAISKFNMLFGQLCI